MANSENNEETMQDEPKKTEKTEKSAKKREKKGGAIQAMKAEMRRIVWPDKDTIIKESTAVVVSTIILGIIIAILDLLIKTGLDKILG